MDKKSARTAALIGALSGWFAVIAQLYLHIQNRPVPVGESLLRFFGYFTIDTNILCALCLTLIALQSNSSLGRFFRRATTVTALTVYITIVGITYNVILRNTWNPQGMQRIVDELLHLVIPIYFIVFWLIFVPIENLKWKDAIPWLIYPIVYMIYALILGAITKFYPYPFVDVNELGYNRSLLNTGLVLLVIFALSLALIATGKLVRKFDDGKKKTIS
jgi:hypothetical protein